MSNIVSGRKFLLLSKKEQIKLIRRRLANLKFNCNSPNSSAYKYVGEKGIKFNDELYKRIDEVVDLVIEFYSKNKDEKFNFCRINKLKDYTFDNLKVISLKEKRKGIGKGIKRSNALKNKLSLVKLDKHHYNWQGYFVTPKGIFISHRDALLVEDFVNKKTLQDRCYSDNPRFMAYSRVLKGTEEFDRVTKLLTFLKEGDDMPQGIIAQKFLLLSNQEKKRVIRKRLAVMKSRCTNPKSTSYKYNGAKGVKFDDELYNKVEDIVALVIDFCNKNKKEEFFITRKDKRKDFTLNNLEITGIIAKIAKKDKTSFKHTEESKRKISNKLKGKNANKWHCYWVTPHGVFTL